MSAQRGLPLCTPAIDLLRFVEWRPQPAEWQQRVVTASGDKRAGQRGVVLGTIGLKHASGYEVVVLLDGGKVDSFAPMGLLPELPE